MSPRTGRPPSEDPKNVRLEIRLTQKEAEKLQKCADLLNISRTAVINKGISLVEQSVKK